ncbi:hypothetical protein RZS08_45110, partial [Arthrospira platensis SPKY1]|nr:hypothetical protein [Arthrospira platensis SPKY1]
MDVACITRRAASRFTKGGDASTRQKKSGPKPNSEVGFKPGVNETFGLALNGGAEVHTFVVGFGYGFH